MLPKSHERRRSAHTPEVEMSKLASAALLAGSVLFFGFADPRPAAADAVADFYRGKTINVLIGVGVGGEYDIQARLVGRHIGKHIPGNPTVVPQNMTGAGGMRMINYLYNVAAKDGTYIGMIANAFPAMQAVGAPGVQFDASKMHWIGSIAPAVETMAVWHTAGVTTHEEARQREVVAGASGRGAITFIYPQMMNELLGTKFKIVTGYPGGNEINLAMERGEVQARNNTWSSWKATKPAWIKEKKLIVIAQAGPRAPDLDAPSVEDAARTPEERQLIELVMSGTQFGRPLATNAGVPAERVAALRAAFDATMKDPEFLKEAASLNFEVHPVPGQKMQQVVDKLLATPKPIKDRAKTLLE
jgi:tripartite-type tricarboxylate transporter receptor subunit TctC